MRKSILTFAAFAVITGGLATQASAQDVKVKDGDTLWGLSQKYEVSVEQLKSLNNLTSDMIYSEEILKVSQEKHQEKYHTVKKGDTLSEIANQYGVTVDNLKSWNKLSSDMIFPDTKLAVSGNGNSIASQPVQKKAEPVKKAAVKQDTARKAVKAASTTSSPEGVKSLSVKATAYTASCEGCSGVTATGVDLKANPNAKVIAVDPDVIPLGSKVYVEGYGYATAADTGGAINGNRIDVFVPNHGDASNWGVRQVNVKILK